MEWFRRRSKIVARADNHLDGNKNFSDAKVLRVENAHTRNALNGVVRQAIGLGGRGLKFKLLTRRDTTQSERRKASHYFV